MSTNVQEVQAGNQGGDRYTILVVEDDLLTLEMMGLLLSDCGYDILKAATCEEAVDIGNQSRIDLVISDIGLPDGCALELMRTLAKRGAVPGISVSGYGPSSHMREAGFVDHVTKPVEFSELLDKIEKLRNSWEPAEQDAKALPFA